MTPDDNSFRFLDTIFAGVGGLLLLLWNGINGRVKSEETARAELSRKLDEHMTRSEDRHVELLKALHEGLNSKADKT